MTQAQIPPPVIALGREWLLADEVQVSSEYVRGAGAAAAAQVYRFHWVVAWVVLHHLPELWQRN